jgi:hypothetical protein
MRFDVRFSFLVTFSRALTTCGIFLAARSVYTADSCANVSEGTIFYKTGVVFTTVGNCTTAAAMIVYYLAGMNSATISSHA